MDENSVYVVLSFINDCGAILINCPNCLFGNKVNNAFGAYCYWLDYNATSTDSSFGTSCLSLSWSTSFFILPKSFIVSEDNNPDLYSVFTLKTILFSILFGQIYTGRFAVKVSCFLVINSK